jgi:hypothetical protein
LDYFSGEFWLVLFRFLRNFWRFLGWVFSQAGKIGVDGLVGSAYISPSRRSKTTRLVRETIGYLVLFSNIKQAVEKRVGTDL